MITVAAVCASFIVFGFALEPKTEVAIWFESWNRLMRLGEVWAIAYTSLRQRAADDARRKTAEELAPSENKVRMSRVERRLCINSDIDA